MKILEVLDQAQLDCVPDDFEGIIIIKGNVSLSRVWENASAVLWGNARAELWENASAELWENARAVLRENARAVLRENARAELWENASAELWENASAELRENARAELRGNASAELWENASAVLRENARAELWENASAELRGNASAVLRENARAELRGNASAVLRENARAELWENARAVLWENARANAQGNSCIHAYSNSIIFAGKCASVHKMRGHAGSITGGVIIEQPGLKTAEDWCAYNGVVIKDGVATLFKAVRDDYKSAHDFLYTPGSTPECPDWDGGVAECRGGLHFCPSPGQALSFDDHATRFLACPVALVDIRSPNDSDRYPYKVKAARICGPIVEVDRFGEPLKEMGGKPV